MTARPFESAESARQDPPALMVPFGRLAFSSDPAQPVATTPLLAAVPNPSGLVVTACFASSRLITKLAVARKDARLIAA